MAAELQELHAGGAFYESPRWHDGRWWVSDFYTHEVLAITTDGESEPMMTVEGQPSGLGWMADGSMLVVSMKDHKLLRRSPEGEIGVHADVSEHCGGNLNDMVVDSAGRAYLGNFGFDLMAFADPAPAKLIRVDPDGTVSVAAEDLLFPNGSVITPDGETLIVGETAACRYTAWTIGKDGSLSDRRVWAQLAPAPEIGPLAETLAKLGFAPDGCSLDADGAIWAADAVGGRCARVIEGGEITDEITAPEGLGFFACGLGGEDGRTLLICAAPDFIEGNREGTSDAVLLTAQVETPHAGLP